ncbi:hypothetical protein BU17DRAFT_49724 [Hysterangium stoloniferum]|nr:hypothetical protein BU17DRAFT_49724 [Hysterangium stoloniferum]
MATPSSSTKPAVQSFEFTKRKRWTDTLFSEISETLFLIVSPSFKVLYCGSAVAELLGWKEDQLIDADLTAFIEEEDVENFVWTFTEAFRLGHDLFTYARFKYEQVSSPANHTMLFEVKGHPHAFDGEQQPQCFFLSAMPYPSRDIALLNTFLDLKIENERLFRRIQELKSAPESSSTELHSPQYPMGGYSQRYGQASGLLLPNNPSMYSRNSSASFLYDGEESKMGAALSIPGAHRRDTGDDDCEDAQRKKKSPFGDEQRVCMTCGRTDSPEWRKGPHGPKTLCNACGLRWAKRTRKDEPDANLSQNRDHLDKGNVSNTEPSSLPFGNNQAMML